MTQAPSVGLLVTKPLNLSQLQAELGAASINVTALGTQAEEGTTYVFTYDAEGLPADMPEGSQAVIDAHIAMRDKTDAELSVEFQDPNTTAVRKQEIRDQMSGLLPREQVPMT
jgi:hypothetical protein